MPFAQGNDEQLPSCHKKSLGKYLPGNIQFIFPGYFSLQLMKNNYCSLQQVLYEPLNRRVSTSQAWVSRESVARLHFAGGRHRVVEDRPG